MCNVHPKLIETFIEQNSRAVIAMILVSLVYVSIFIKFVPVFILLAWFLFQIFLAMFRFQNAKMLKKSLAQGNVVDMEKYQKLFLVSSIFQASMWTLASIFSVVYAPQPFELVTFVMVVGIITAAALSMSTLYIAYLTFFLFIIIPQLIILLSYGELQHIALLVFAVIYIPVIILLSKTLYESRVSAISASEALAKNVDNLHTLSITDTLTSLYNRRYFFEVSENMVSIAFRERKKVSLLMIDIDYFKKINDTYGHQVGDFILVEFTKEIKRITRNSDIFARIGGEEFTVLLNDTFLDGAKVIAEKIRKAIENKKFIYNDTSINITVSIGVCTLSEEFDSVEKLYKEADARLYKAKERGRNQVY